MKTNPKQTKVCVVGAGVSGVACAKELSQQGIAVDVYEMMPITGGVFGSYSWKGGQFTSSTVFTWYSDFPIENRQKFLTWREFLDYLEDYIDHFDLRASINLNCKVTAIEKKGDGWIVNVKKKNWSNGHYFHPKQEVIEEDIVSEYSHVIICSGLHNVPQMPKVEGLDAFAGKVMHSNTYRDAEDFRGQRVVVVGAGESGSDIAHQVAKVAKSCTISMRSAPGTLFPKFIQGNTPDIRDDRLSYNLPRIWSSFILKVHRNFYNSQKENPEVFQWAAASNFNNNQCSFNTNACKSFGIPEAVVNSGAVLKPSIVRADQEGVTYSDGTHTACDAIIFCTGYKATFSFLSEEISDKLLPVNNLWKNCVDPSIGETLLLIGFSRPQQINLITVAEMQSRMAALLITKQRQLPSPAAMRQQILDDQGWMQKYYGVRYKKNPALIDYLYYLDKLSKFIGCEVPLWKALFKDPHLWLKLIFSSMNGAHYRLQGPGSNWEQSAKTIKQTPQFKNWKNATFRWSILSGLTIYSIVLSIFNKDYRLIKTQAEAEG